MPSNIKVVNKYHRVPYDIFIGRGSKWGNPFSSKDSTKAIFKVDTKEEALELYEAYIRNTKELYDSLSELDGKTLCCYCRPAKCHGDILKALRDEQLAEIK